MGVLEFSGSWDQVSSFLSQSRAKYLPFHMPIIVLCPAVPSTMLENQFRLSTEENVAFVCGSAARRQDLERAGVKECSIIVCLGHQSQGLYSVELAATLDS